MSNLLDSLTESFYDSPIKASVIPGHVPASLVVDFDYHADPAFLADPFAGLDGVRDRRVFFSPRYEGYWVLTRAEDIRAVFQDPATFSSADVAIPKGAYPRVLRPLALDPPEHGAYRQTLTAAFSPAAAARREEEVRSVCRALVDAVAPTGGCDLMHDLAKPLPTTVFVDLVGLPAADAGQFLEWNDALLHAYDDPAKRRWAATSIESYLADAVARRRGEGERGEGDSDGDDVLSTLVRAHIAGRAITDDEVLDVLFLLFMAGLDTVTAATGFAFAMLARRVDLQRRLVDEPAVVPAAVEELLRIHGIVNAARTATRDATIADGVTVKAGDRILLATALANRDPGEFPDPLTVDFDRTPNRHVAFGAGPHRCLGSHLARLEMRIALEEFHRRIPSYRLAPGHKPTVHGGGVFGMDRLPLEWDAP
jgi:cytochrome P450